MLAYHNGAFQTLDEVRISPLDPGFSGIAVVDNTRTFAGKLFRWKQHLERLRRDCATCRIPLELEESALTYAAEKLLDTNGVGERDLHVITVITPGPTVFMHTKELNVARYKPFFEIGAKLQSVKGGQSSYPKLLPPTVKHRSRMLWHIAESAPRPQNCEALLTDEMGSVLETSFAQLLWVCNGTVCRLERDVVLRSVSAEYVEELCYRLGVPFEDQEFRNASAFWEVDEAMLAGTGFGLCGVSEFDGLEKKWPGPVFRKLYAAFCEDVGCDLAATLTPPPSCGPSRS